MISDNITIKYAFFSLHSLPFIPFPRLFVSLYSRAAFVASPSCVLVSIKSRIRSEYFQKEEQLIDEECNKRWALRLWFLNLKHCCCCQTKSGTSPPLEFRTKSPKWLQLMSDEYLCFKIKFFCVLMSDILFIVWKPISCILKSDKDYFVSKLNSSVLWWETNIVLVDKWFAVSHCCQWVSTISELSIWLLYSKITPWK